MRMSLFDAVSRALALPAIVSSASSVLRSHGVLTRLSENFISRVEDECRTRWSEIFAATPDPDDDTELEDAA